MTDIDRRAVMAQAVGATALTSLATVLPDQAVSRVGSGQATLLEARRRIGKLVAIGREITAISARDGSDSAAVFEAEDRYWMGLGELKAFQRQLEQSPPVDWQDLQARADLVAFPWWHEDVPSGRWTDLLALSDEFQTGLERSGALLAFGLLHLAHCRASS